MPRKPRMYIMDVPCHIVQRGNDRCASFFLDQDYLFYLECLYEATQRHRVAVHAYVLMTNHVHLLMTPSTKEGISMVMQSLGRRYVQYINKEYGRTGTLWEGRHKASLVDAEAYLLKCYRYIELNPVAANMVLQPSNYAWSSFRRNALGHGDKLITEHEVYSRLGKDKLSRNTVYLELFREVLSKAEQALIRNAAQFFMPTGDLRFKEQIESMLQRKLGNAYRGRPRKKL